MNRYFALTENSFSFLKAQHLKSRISFTFKLIFYLSLMRHFLFIVFASVLTTFQVYSQRVPAQLVNPVFLFSTYDFASDEGDLKAAILQQVGEKALPEIIENSIETVWPTGIATLSARTSNKLEMVKYTCYKVVSTDELCILHIPATENQTMPAYMRPQKDMFFIIGLEGVLFDGNNFMYEPAPLEDGYPEEDVYVEDAEDEIVLISNPAELVPNFDLRNCADFKQLVLEVLGEEEMNILIELASEKSWPLGISTAVARKTVQDKMKEYVVVFAASFEQDSQAYILVWVPFYGNEHMPPKMQPLTEDGFYFVFKADGIEFQE